MEIMLRATQDKRWDVVLVVVNGRGDAKLLAWLATKAKAFEVTNSPYHRMVRVRWTKETSDNFLVVFRNSIGVGVEA